MYEKLSKFWSNVIVVDDSIVAGCGTKLKAVPVPKSKQTSYTLLAPEVPEEPVLPEVPDEPFSPEVPEEPEVPDVPEEPEVPEVPDEPELPEVPDEPFSPEVP